MELHNVNRASVDHVIHAMAQVVGQGQYSLADVAIAVSEFLGRMVVSSCETPISGVQMAQVLETHIKRTLHAGYTAKGYNMGHEDFLGG
jgi:hypothetical protein